MLARSLSSSQHSGVRAKPFAVVIVLRSTGTVGFRTMVLL